MKLACRIGAALLGLVLPGRAAAQDLMSQARALQARGRLDSALAMAEAAARAEPQRAEAHYLVGDLAGQRAQQINNLSALGLARKCKGAYGRAVQLEPDNVRYLQSLAGFLSQAPGIAGGDRDSALVLAERVRRLDEPAGTFLMADVLRRGNGRQKARADSLIEAWSRSHATDRAAQFRVASYWSASGRTERALAIAERLLADDPNDAVARFAVARHLVVLRRDPGRAIGYLHQVLAAPPPPAGGPSYQPAAAWWRMGQAFVLMDQTDSARMAYERSLALDRSFRPARLSLDSLGIR